MCECRENIVRISCHCYITTRAHTCTVYMQHALAYAQIQSQTHIYMDRYIMIMIHIRTSNSLDYNYLNIHTIHLFMVIWGMIYGIVLPTSYIIYHKSISIEYINIIIHTYIYIWIRIYLFLKMCIYKMDIYIYI